MLHEHRHEPVQTFGIFVVETANRRTIDIENAEQLFTTNEGNDDF